MVSGVLKGAGIIGTVAAALVGIAFAGDKLSKVYEQHMDSIMNINNLLGRFGETAEETSYNFGITMKEISEAGTRYGYDLQTSMAITRNLITQAGTMKDLDLREIMYFQRFGGFDPGQTTRYQGMGRRFGFGGNAEVGFMERALGTMRQSGMERGLFGEFLEGSVQIFEQGIARGVVKGFDEINVMQSVLAGMGPAYQGQYGLRVYQGMEQAVVGATGLQAEKDVMMYRAARRMIGGEPSYITVMKTLEKGMTQDLLSYLLQDIKRITGGVAVDMMELLRSTLGVTYTQAGDILAARERIGGVTVGYEEPGYGVRGTPEMRLLGIQTQIQQMVREWGKVALPGKTFFLGGTVGNVVQALSDIANNLSERRLDRAEWKEVTKTIFSMPETEENFRRIMTDPRGQRPNIGLEFFDVLKTSIEGGRKYKEFPEVEVSGRQLASMFNTLTGSPEAIRNFMESGAIWTAVERARGTRAPGEPKAGFFGGGGFTPYDLPDILAELVGALKTFNENAAEGEGIDINLNNFIEGGEQQ